MVRKLKVETIKIDGKVKQEEVRANGERQLLLFDCEKLIKINLPCYSLDKKG